jgi:hypothetical protein
MSEVIEISLRRTVYFNGLAIPLFYRAASQLMFQEDTFPLPLALGITNFSQG